MLKKFINLCVVMSIPISLTIPNYAMAAENPITSDTIVTKDNIYEVLDYLDIDSNDFIATNDYEDIGISTVGELEDAIVESQSKIKDFSFVGTGNTISTSNNAKNSDNLVSINSGINTTVELLYTLDCDSYWVDFTASGTYFKNSWTACSSPNAVADTDSLIYVFKVTKKDLELSMSFDATKIIMEGTINVNHYL